MRLLLWSILIMVSPVCLAQSGDSVFLYRRGSICSFMIGHRDLQYAEEIEKAFNEMPVPDKYNDHNLGKKVFYTSEKKLKMKGLDQHSGFKVNESSDKEQMNDYDIFLQKQFIASRLIAKWFNRKKNTGTCDVTMIHERGLYNASEAEKRLAAVTIRKSAMLMDAGEELIGSTFVLINDIRYIDRSKGSSAIGGVVSAVTKVSAAINGVDMTDTPDLGTLIATYKGFNVKIKTYLYQLVWDEPIANYFYDDIYTEKPDETKKENFENNRGKFSLVYLGMQESSGKDISFAGINESEPQTMVRKACQRALDENIASLQKNFDVFRIKTPLVDTQPLKCEIGKKDGVSESSRYEVLEAVQDSEGRINYERVGVIRPVKGSIWDNRYMAKEEGAENANLGATTFEKVSGRDFEQGMLVREIK